VELPHPIEAEVEARRVIERAYAYKSSDPMRLEAAYRVVARNSMARTSERELELEHEAACKRNAALLEEAV
jgi:hypothetical protein